MIKKRLFAGLLTAAMLLAVLPIGAAALESSYTVPFSGATITVEKLNFPSGISGVSYIGSGVFYYTDSTNSNIRHFIDRYGNALGSYDRSNVTMYDFHDGLCRVDAFDPYTAKDGYGFIDSSGQYVVQPTYSQAEDFSDGLAAVRADSIAWGYIDKSGSMAIEPKYTSAAGFHDGYAVVTYQTPSNCGMPNNYLAIIDKSGNEVWTSPTKQYSNGFGGTYELAIYHQVSNSLVYDGKVVLSASSDSGRSAYVLVGIDGTIQDLPDAIAEGDPVIYAGNDRFWVTKSLRPGLYDIDGNVIIPHLYMNYEMSQDDEHGLVIASSATTGYQIIDYDGNVVIPLGELSGMKFYDGVSMGSLPSDYRTKYLLTVSGGSASTAEPTQPAQPAEPAYSDEPSSWAKAEVGEAIGLGLVPEALQSEYTRPITRAEFCSLGVALYERSSGEITERAEFSDTDDVNVQKLAGLGIVNGVGGGKFNPDASITRQEAAAMLSRLAEAMGSAIDSAAPDFTDSGDIAGWASEAVGQMQSSGIMNGVDGGRFDPAGSYTREQSIMTIVRMLDIL